MYKVSDFEIIELIIYNIFLLQLVKKSILLYYKIINYGNFFKDIDKGFIIFL